MIGRPFSFAETIYDLEGMKEVLHSDYFPIQHETGYFLPVKQEEKKRKYIVVHKKKKNLMESAERRYQP